jgi:hypothetical protein
MSSLPSETHDEHAFIFDVPHAYISFLYLDTKRDTYTARIHIVRLFGGRGIMLRQGARGLRCSISSKFTSECCHYAHKRGKITSSTEDILGVDRSTNRGICG